MRLFGAERFSDGSRKIFWLMGLPLYYKKQGHGEKRLYLFGFVPVLSRHDDGFVVRTRVLGIRMDKKSRDSYRQSVGVDLASVAEIAGDMRIILDRMPFDYWDEAENDIPRKNKIRVLFEGSGMVFGGKRGIGGYCRGLLCEMAKYDDIEIDVIFKNDVNIGKDVLLPKNVRVVKWADFERFSQAYDFMFFGYPGEYILLDVISNPQKLSKIRSLVGIIHDFIPQLFPMAEIKCNNATQEVLREILFYARKLDHVFANSENTRADCMKIAERLPRDITVIMGGADKEWSKAPSAARLRNDDIIAGLGGHRRKNVLRTVEAFAMARASGKIPKKARLVITSYLEGNSDMVTEIEEMLIAYPKCKIGKQVVLPKQFLSTASIIRLTGNARAAIYPSLYEGLGMPVLEAYTVGTPCIGSNNSSVAEIIAPECRFDPRDVRDMSDKIIEIYNSGRLREISMKFGKKLITKTCNWKIAAAKTVKTLRRLKADMAQGPAVEAPRVAAKK
ncbi:MAG: glycosyltransferase [Rickettsiales bacterium]|jgi:glycosyltransferase involved in cell wall biosynthesis|nr:glycosyltransferase [Rickettsiales bacterium]